MISKFLLLAGLIPVVASFLARKFFCDRVVKRYKGEKMSITAGGFAKAVLKAGAGKKVEILEKRRPFLPLKPDILILSPGVVKSREVGDVAEAGLRAGMTLLAQRQEKVVAWRVWAVKFATSLPIFTMIVMFFALMMGRGSWALGVISAAFGLGCVALWMTLAVEREAARVVASLLDEKGLVKRRSESELLGKLMKAGAWRRIIPFL